MRDFDIRLALKNTSLLKFYDQSSVVVEELCLPCTGSRIDIAVVNGSLHGFEIKSASDNLLRLPSQIEGYTKVFDYLTIITEEKHTSKIEALAPAWIGVSYIKKTGDELTHEIVRPALKNTNTEGFYIAKLLRKEELQSLMAEFNLPYKKSFRAWTLCEILAENIPPTELSEAVRIKLKAREDWKLNSKAGLRFL